MEYVLQWAPLVIAAAGWLIHLGVYKTKIDNLQEADDNLCDRITQIEKGESIPIKLLEQKVEIIAKQVVDQHADLKQLNQTVGEMSANLKILVEWVNKQRG